MKRLLMYFILHSFGTSFCLIHIFFSALLSAMIRDNSSLWSDCVPARYQGFGSR